MSLVLKRFTYPILITWLYALCPLVTYSLEVDKVPSSYQELFLVLKLFFGCLGLLQGIYFFFFGFSDRGAAVIFSQMVVYSLLMMWFAPIYEVAYFQCAIGCSFLTLRRSWIYPTIYGIGLIGIFINYEAMEYYQWKSPVATKEDWIGISIVFFLLSWCIQKYAIGSYRKEQDRLARFSVIGKETTKLTHDIKGMLSSPLLIIDSLHAKDGTISVDTYRSQMKHLAKDMENVHSVLRSIHRLVTVGEEVRKVSLLESWQSPLQILSRRLAHIQLSMPEDKMILGNQDRLNSIFFNLLLNSIEAFENAKQEKPFIKVYWENMFLVYEDNAGGVVLPKTSDTTKENGSGLGLQLVRNDMEKMGADIQIKSLPPYTKIYLRFQK